MMKRIMTPRVAALALAATPLFAAPALADAPGRHAAASPAVSVNLGDASLYVSVGHDRWRDRDGRYHNRSRYGQAPWEVRQMRREARQMCVRAVNRAGYRAGFRDVDVDDDIRTRQIGRYAFQVRLDDVEFEGRRREFERDVTCVVRRGRIESISGIPQPGRGHGYHRGHDDYRYDDWHHRYDRGLRGGRPGS